jgi:hypothetical protein
MAATGQPRFIPAKSSQYPVPTTWNGTSPHQNLRWSSNMFHNKKMQARTTAAKKNQQYHTTSPQLAIPFAGGLTCFLVFLFIPHLCMNQMKESNVTFDTSVQVSTATLAPILSTSELGPWHRCTYLYLKRNGK